MGCEGRHEAWAAGGWIVRFLRKVNALFESGTVRFSSKSDHKANHDSEFQLVRRALLTGLDLEQ